MDNYKAEEKRRIQQMIVQGYYSDICEPDTEECKECMHKCEEYWKAKGYEE